MELDQEVVKLRDKATHVLGELKLFKKESARLVAETEAQIPDVSGLVERAKFLAERQTETAEEKPEVGQLAEILR